MKAKVFPMQITGDKIVIESYNKCHIEKDLSDDVTNLIGRRHLLW